MRIIFCIPGNNFSDRWLYSWIDTTRALSKANIDYAISIAYDPVVYYARNRVLGGNNVDGRNQKPFRGQVQYDYQFWIDSDMVWTGEDVIKLLEMDKPVASGCYMMANNQELPIVESLDWDHLAEAGAFKFLTRDELATKSAPFTASYAGFGFMCIKRGVMESMDYPWFQPRFVDYKDFYDFSAEDVGFCWRAAELGHQIWVDPSVRVGHQKSLTLMP